MRPISVRTIALVLGSVILVAAATFLFLVGHRPPDTTGQARLHLYYKSRTIALLPLPSGWRARYGIDRHERCAILIDAALAPRFMACTFGFGRDNPEYARTAVTAAAQADTASTRRRNAGDRLVSDVRETPQGPIHHVVHDYYTPASFHVVTTGQVIEHEFFRTIGNGVVLLRTYEDATQRSTLDPITWELALGMMLVPGP